MITEKVRALCSFALVPYTDRSNDRSDITVYVRVQTLLLLPWKSNQGF